MVNLNTTLGHNLFQITIRNGVTHIEKHCVQDHIFRVMAAFEIECHGYYSTYSLFKQLMIKSDWK